MKIRVNILNQQMCCFCKNWFDPECEVIKPTYMANIYEVNLDASRVCMVNHCPKKANSGCARFTPKF
jgi:hypothetical protein